MIIKTINALIILLKKLQISYKLNLSNYKIKYL